LTEISNAKKSWTRKFKAGATGYMTAPTIPNSEPSTIVAGDSVAWTKTITSYAGTLNYSLQIFGSSDPPILFAATPPGGPNFSISLAPGVTANWAPGRYTWTSYIDDGTNRHAIDTGEMVVLANPAIAVAGTHATRTLAIIEAALEGRLPRGLETYVIDGQSIAKIPIKQLVEMRSIYADWVRSEYAQDRINRGESNPRNSFARFRRVRSSGSFFR
jgi:hypothetical protein